MIPEPALEIQILYRVRIDEGLTRSYYTTVSSYPALTASDNVLTRSEAIET